MKVSINNLALKTRLGVPDEERARVQHVSISVEMELSSEPMKGDINETIDYEAVANDIRVVAETERKLLETFAHDIAEMIQKKYKPVSVRVTAHKFVLPDTESVSVTVTLP